MQTFGTIAACSILLVSLLPGPVLADCNPWMARLLSLEGTVEVKRRSTDSWRASTVGETYCLGDHLRVAARSRASVELNNDTILRLDQNSLLILPETEQKELSFVELLRGALHLISRIRGSLEIRTPFVNAGLEGTEFVVRVHDEEAVVSVIEGRVKVSNSLGSLRLVDGQTAVGTRTSAPVLRLDLKPTDAVQWAIHYPLLGHPAQDAGRAVIGDVGRLLRVGRAGEARQRIDALLADNPDDSEALALAAIVDLAQNRKTDALMHAQRAVDIAPSTAALSALSYAKQAHLELDGALQVIERAVRLYPDDALIRARQAELQASLGRLDDALATAQRAVEIDPDISRTQTVLGFARLQQHQWEAASAAFRRAGELDQGDPLPRLGLGLTRIRAGELAAGRRELEIAVSLDPGNALLRSYLGKAYAAEQRDREAVTEYALARQLDPLDPTPWLYEAVQKQSANRPAEALDALERSIALNDNRAVFRSRLHLDQDEAARGVNVGRVYADLGFDMLAARRGWRAATLDPTNASAHELLADAYAGRARYEIARASELMQASLLQGLGAFPVRSLTFDSEPLIPESLGPSDPSPGEYSRLFNRAGTGAQTDFFVGSNKTKGDRIAAYMLGERFSVLGTQYHFETDGFRPNDDLTVDVYNLMGQFLLAEGNIVHFEIQRDERDNGDLELLFDLDDFSSNNRERLDTDIIRLGHRFDLDPHTTLLTSLIHSKTETHNAVNEFVGSIPFVGSIFQDRVSDSEIEAYLAELQLLVEEGSRHWVAGFGHYNEDSDGEEDLSFSPPLFPSIQTDLGGKLEHTNAYLYSYHNLRDAQLTLGLSFDTFEVESGSGRIDTSKVHPKLGLVWQPVAPLTIRTAFAKTLMPSLINDRTLQPTHVAGFNQFFDDIAGSRATLAGLGVEYLFSAGHAAGLEISGRDLDVPFQSGASEEQEERTVRAYYYRTIADRWSTRLAVEQDDFERDPASLEARRPETLKTRRIPIGVRYHDPRGLFADLTATNVRQEIKGLAAPGGEATEDFWTIDAGVGYRMPNRRGSVELRVRNLLDQQFHYFGEDFQSGRIPRRDFVPERTLEMTLSLNW